MGGGGNASSSTVVSGDVARVSQASELRRDRGVAVADVRISRRAAAYESKRVPEGFGWGCEVHCINSVNRGRRGKRQDQIT
jgi:hypothetical protein